ncbi:RNA polymerase sigma factor [Roseivirga sp. BDSF3-8]|uniref:RNA polymerase sigma factor n=1 Tax=Roseivirga sp. BDSF3-8 TaxID=3241598 RepID=UPI003531EE1D
MDEHSLISGLKDKDKKALAYLYDHYADALYGVILRITREEDLAEEVLQDAFMRFWDRIGQYEKGKGTLFTWMMAIARNLALDKLRAKGMKLRSKSDSLSDNVYQLDKENYTETSTDAIGLDSALKELTDDQRFVIDKLYFRGYTQSEVAKEYDIPLGTVKTRLRAAMVRLKKVIIP